LNRVERYRRKRIERKRYITALLMLAVLLAAGILAVDCSTNRLVSGRGGVALASLDNRGDCLVITVMNHKLLINTKYVSRDLQNLKKIIGSLVKWDEGTGTLSLLWAETRGQVPCPSCPLRVGVAQI
jgi:hypothetical protein